MTPAFHILHLDSSLTGPASVSRLLSRETVDAWRAADPAVRVTYRDLAVTVPPQLTPETVDALRQRSQPASAQGRAELAHLNTLLDEFLAADAIVIGAPMYNFGVPTQLKAWIDALAQAGRTFEYTPQGPRGLAGRKRVVIASSRGNIYSTPPQMQDKDFQERYLVAVLQFMGITRFDVVRAEGVNRGPEVRDAALASARAAIAQLFAAHEAVAP
jgi:FMN-dependent NADH-azoreductase